MVGRTSAIEHPGATVGGEAAGEAHERFAGQRTGAVGGDAPHRRRRGCRSMPATTTGCSSGRISLLRCERSCPTRSRSTSPGRGRATCRGAAPAGASRPDRHGRRPGKLRLRSVVDEDARRSSRTPGVQENVLAGASGVVLLKPLRHVIRGERPGEVIALDRVAAETGDEALCGVVFDPFGNSDEA